ncbi:foldase protein PrsA [Peribacillus deserti]|uniref:Foldase protein PrsA n=1 Tax=Peribacillus deserti TaxID=673318 RepID=A0ABS2QLK2_9BACI|nr:peptidylprolyl isomerase [Peribacillus deserti]MBM7694048.1 foldase protein PrsA [Peribacillus deserti]
MKKWALSIAVTAGLLGLTACNNNGGGSDAVVETKAGDVTKDELYNSMKTRYGNKALQELVYEKVLTEKYKVSNKEVNEKVDKVKAELGPQFAMALQQYGYKDEADLKRSFKIGLLQERAAIKDVKATDKEIKDAYDNFTPEIKARHILVQDEKTAAEVKQKLDKGEKFEDLAKKYSKDPGSAEKGGDLGWFGPGKMVPEFEAAAYKLNKDQISNPVKTEHGYHIIQLTDKKEKESLDKMKKELEYQVKVSKLTPEIVQKAMDRELKAAKVEIKDKDLKKALDAAPAETPQ